MSNGPHLRPPANGRAGADTPAAGLPDEIPPELRAQVEWLNTWASFAQVLRPIPTSFNVAAVSREINTPEGVTVRPFVRVTSFGPTGARVDFIPPELAEELAGLLKRYALEARTGITVADAGAYGPGPNGRN